MAFPASYNINYYSGDTLQLLFAPKQSSGEAFSLSGFSAKMSVSKFRGATGANIAFTLQSGTSAIVINTNQNTILVTISATNGNLLDPALEYVYDLQITDGSAVYTLVTGTITVTEDVTA